MKIFSVLLILLLFQVMAFAQEPEEESPVIRKKDTVPNFVRTWIMTEDFTVVEDYRMDTAQTGFQVSNPIYKKSISQSFLGVVGLQTRDNLYFNINDQPDYYFLRPFSPYLYTPEKNVYYNITTPFSLVEYCASTGDRKKREEIFRVIHSQNITPFFNMGLDIRFIGSEGSYLRQKAKFNSVNLFGSYTGNDYSIYSSFHLNTQTAQENGGLLNDSTFRHTDKDERAYEIKLENAESKMRNMSYHFTQRYKFGKTEQIADTTSKTGFRKLRERATKTGSLIHNLEYQRSFRLYTDKITDENRDFYPNYFIDPKQTDDSTYYRSLSNTFQLMLDENPNRANDFGARVFIRHDWDKYAFNTANDSSFQNGDTTVISHKEFSYHNVHVGASFLHTVGEGWDWLARGRYYLFGYKATDLILDGYITKRFQGRKGMSTISISGKFAIEEPDHFLNFYESNNYQWNNDFQKIKDVNGSLTLSNQAIKTQVKFDISLISDLVFFNDSAVPVQHQSTESIISGELRKNFKAGIFHSNHQINYQISSDNNVIRIPDLSYYNSTFLGFVVVKNALTAEIGFDLYYYSKYRALAFAPSSGSFYNQDILEIGNYPYLTPFLNAKLKRTRFYLRLDHPYAGQIEKNYFHVLGYPTRGKVFKFGLSWTFYN